MSPAAKNAKLARVQHTQSLLRGENGFLGDVKYAGFTLQHVTVLLHELRSLLGRKKIKVVFANHVLPIVTQQCFTGTVKEDKTQVSCSLEEHHQRQVFDDGFRQLFGLLQGLFGLSAFGDVTQESHQTATFNRQVLNADFHVKDLSVFAAMLGLKAIA